MFKGRAAHRGRAIDFLASVVQLNTGSDDLGGGVVESRKPYGD